MGKRTIQKVDVAILGAGTAGLSARRAAQAAGAQVALIDPGPFGTTCARVGCMPSKLLIAAADAAHHARHADLFGVHAEGVRVDGRTVLGRVRSERDRFVGFVEKVIDEAREAGELVVGRGRLTEPGVLNVGDHSEVRFERLVIATGTSPFVPPPFRRIEQALLTNENVFELAELPESLLVVGLGATGLELGQAFHRLGVRTTLVGIDDIVGPIGDPEILAEAKTTFGKELDLHPDYELKEVAPVEGGVCVRFIDSDGHQRDERYERVLMAAGRQNGLNKLGLDVYGVEYGIEPDANGSYPIDPDTLQLGKAPIFVAGDVNELHPILHEANDDGRVAGHNAARFRDMRAAQRRAQLAIVFTDPQIAIVGGGYAALGDRDASVGEVDYDGQGRARVMGENQGRVRVYAEKHSGRLIGAELLGPSAEHLAHLLAWAVQQRLTVEQILAMPFYHPVVEEGLRTALRDLNARLRHGAPIKCAVSEIGVGS